MGNIHTIPLHLGDLLTDTMHLSAAELGGYIRLLAVHYRMGANGLPEDESQLRRITGLDNKTWKASRLTILEYFELSGDRRWVHGRVQKTLFAIAQKQEQNRDKALKRWNPPHAVALPQHSHGYAEAVPAISLKPKAKGEGKPSPPSVAAMPFPSLPPEWKRWAEEDRGWDSTIVSDVWLQFKEYWTTGKGRTTRRENWEPTWRNWCRKEHFKPQGEPHAFTSRHQPAKSKFQLAVEATERARAARESREQGQT